MESSNTITLRKIEPSSLEILRTVVINNFNHLIFRRVKRVITKDENFIETIFSDVENGKIVSEIFKPGKQREFTEEEYEHNVEERYLSFYFFTSESALRDNDTYDHIEIFGASNKYSQLDLTNVIDFRFSYNRSDHVNLVAPRVNDLICGLVEKDDHGRKNPSFKFWFNCSEQFFHAWTAIKYSEHESLDRLITSERIVDAELEIRRKLMKGNRLCTNSFRKWQLANIDHDIKPEAEEEKSRFYILRTERNSVDWVHLYAALVLILRYRELPNENNIPINVDDGPVMKQWDLPEGWIDHLISRYHLQEVEEKHKVNKTNRTQLRSGNRSPRKSSSPRVIKHTTKKLSEESTQTPNNTPVGCDTPLRKHSVIFVDESLDDVYPPLPSPIRIANGRESVSVLPSHTDDGKVTIEINKPAEGTTEGTLSITTIIPITTASTATTIIPKLEEIEPLRISDPEPEDKKIDEVVNEVTEETWTTVDRRGKKEKYRIKSDQPSEIEKFSPRINKIAKPVKEDFPPLPGTKPVQEYFPQGAWADVDSDDELALFEYEKPQ